jgi:hypothetical protein
MMKKLLGNPPIRRPTTMFRSRSGGRRLDTPEKGIAHLEEINRDGAAARPVGDFSSIPGKVRPWALWHPLPTMSGDGCTTKGDPPSTTSASHMASTTWPRRRGSWG